MMNTEWFAILFWLLTSYLGGFTMALLSIPIFKGHALPLFFIIGMLSTFALFGEFASQISVTQMIFCVFSKFQAGVGGSWFL